MAKSLFDKYGGFARLSHVVMALYDALLDDDTLGPYFDDVDMKALIDHQTKFVASLLGGPASFSTEHLSRAHQRLSISDPEFDRMKEILGDTLAEHGFSAEDVAAVIQAIETHRPLVVAA